MERFVAETDAYRTHSVHDLITLKGKTAVITGGGRGLGLAIARGCAELGANIAVLDVLEHSDDVTKLEEGTGIKTKYYRVDVTQKKSLESTFEDIKNHFGSIDCLVTAAGVGTGGPFVDNSMDQINRIISINVTGTILCSQLAVQQMLKQGTGGAIVTISSIGGHGGIVGQKNAVYCASKGAILGFTKSLAVELAESGIRVNSISPGFFLTKMTPGYQAQDVALLEAFEKPIPMKRFADRSEIKSIAAFLLTEASSYITGEDIAVDGGILAA
ncbi:dehydrogenase with different specificitie [Exophiala viscosa]|uniref:dehydrogenase with different specificitie n=1 Tax=Exophiala viscosa TaxID=2486360 RepID=UPI002195D686|nr:dehydrogenase with different specificitie [Exophiala viscosa]